MSRPFDMIEWLEKAAESAILEGYRDEYEACHQVIAFIESLPKNLVDDWKPSLPSIDDAAKIFRESKDIYGTDWVVGEDRDSLIGPPELGMYERRWEGLEARLEAAYLVRLKETRKDA